MPVKVLPLDLTSNVVQSAFLATACAEIFRVLNTGGLVVDSSG